MHDRLIKRAEEYINNKNGIIVGYARDGNLYSMLIQYEVEE